ncbi:MAG: RDD family protein [Pyrinomonadaceae bacterium]
MNVKKTSQTLVGFQSKNSTLPDWRLQLQNTVRQRSGGSARHVVSDQDAVAGSQARLVTSGANALKAETTVTPPVPSSHANPRVANALKRIEDSRQAFLANTAAAPPPSPAKSAAARSYPFNVIARAPQPPRVQPTRTENTAVKPRLVSSLRIEKKGLDTNKLPSLPQAATIAEIDEFSIAAYDNILPPPTFAESERLEVKHAQPEPETERSSEFEIEDIESDEIDDLAPFSMRFGAGLFDFIIGAFATAILMSPVILSGGDWMTFSGVLAFTAALAIVLFVYLTASIGFLGRTFGMRLFSLEMIDAEENAYPTLHQAAVSSSVYLLSIALGGLGFVPALFNEERRAMHDILSGTILIREV